jgi:hypothetical protein
MDFHIKQALGVVLGQIYVVKEHLGVIKEPHAAQYGLLHGIEPIIDAEFQRNGPLVTTQMVQDVAAVLRAYENDPGRELKGYLDLEAGFQALEIDRGAAIRILTNFKVLGMFVETINRLNTDASPPECRVFDPED